jgi:4-amino-4-deoxy-L-arabinose transferase-like glycosyltransferase
LAEAHYVKAVLAAVLFLVVIPWLGKRWINRADGTHRHVGAFFIGLAVLMAFLLMPVASESKLPTLYTLLLGGILLGVPAALRIAAVSGRLRQRKLPARLSIDKTPKSCLAGHQCLPSFAWPIPTTKYRRPLRRNA